MHGAVSMATVYTEHVTFVQHPVLNVQVSVAESSNLTEIAFGFDGMSFRPDLCSRTRSEHEQQRLLSVLPVSSSQPCRNRKFRFPAKTRRYNPSVMENCLNEDVMLEDQRSGVDCSAGYDRPYWCQGLFDGKWHQLKLLVRPPQLSGFLDDRLIRKAPLDPVDPIYINGKTQLSKRPGSDLGVAVSMKSSARSAAPPPLVSGKG